MQDYNICKLSDVIDFNPKEKLSKGSLAKKVSMDKLQPYTKVVSSFDIAKYNGGAKFRNGDTIMARITPCLENGKTSFVDFLDDDEVAFGSTEFVVMRAKEGVTDSQYIYYLATSPEFRKVAIQSMVGSSGRQRVQQGVLNEYEIALPPLEEQKRIAAILSALDDKIELNRRINENLEQQAQALFKSWFVDFEPFGGVSPDNWCKADIYSIANIIYGAPFSSKLFNANRVGKPIIRIRDLKEQVFVTYTTEVHPKGHLIQPGDIIVGMDGEFRPYLWGNTEAWLNQRVCIFESKEAIDKAFVFLTIKPLLSVIEQTQVATTVIHIGKKDFDSFEILLPDRNTLNKFGLITVPMLSQIVSNRLENKRLAELRDSLLPCLMSGELDVSYIDL